jgi:competence protein ComEA
MSERSSRQGRRRPGRGSDLAEAALARLQRTRPGSVPGWVPDESPEAGGGAQGAPDGLAGHAPVSTPPSRLALTPRALAGLAVFLVIGLLLALFYVWLARPRAEPAPALRRSLPATAPPAGLGSPVADQGAHGGAAASGSGGPEAPAGAVVVVDVVGAVRRPGVVELPVGSRVQDAIAAAGGPSARAMLASVNMARPLVDGEQLVLLRKGAKQALAAPPAGATAGTGLSATAGAPAGPVDLNQATLEQLDSLTGIGPVLAQRILDWRTAHGRFSSVDELTEVSGIGESTLADLKPQVRV